MKPHIRCARLAELARHHDDDRSNERTRAARAIFERSLSNTSALSTWNVVWRAWRQPFRVVAATAVIGVAAFAITKIQREPSQKMLSFTVGERFDGGRAGDWVVSRGTNTPIRFSDGSVTTLTPASHARVTTLRPNGADITLEAGALDVAVVHREAAQWTIHAGPFEVRVTGTRFVVAWNAATEAFHLRLAEGSVTVFGCNLPPRSLKAGEVIDEVCHEPDERSESAHGARAPKPEPEAPASASTPNIESPSTAEGHDVQVASILAPQAVGKSHVKSREKIDAKADGEADIAPSPPVWTEAWARGDYPAAYALVEPQFDALTRSSDAATLMQLADLARWVQRRDHAGLALTRCRVRFPKSAEAASAAFFLGRYAADAAHYREASDWFASALREGEGPLRREALGRLVESSALAGDLPAARQHARAYVEAYPDGPHAPLAQSLVAP